MPLYAPCKCEARVKKLEELFVLVATAIEQGGGANGSVTFGPTKSLENIVKAIKAAEYELNI